MIDDDVRKDGIRLVKALPIFLGIQIVILLMTVLDLPLYSQAFQAGYKPVTGWEGVWFMLELFGGSISLILLFSKPWKAVFGAKERGRLASGYWLGVLCGLFTMGFRFLPWMPVQYFYFVGGLVFAWIAAWFAWNKRQSPSDEIFP